MMAFLSSIASMTARFIPSWATLLQLISLIQAFSLHAGAQETVLLNASYDVSREFYRDVNAAFVKAWREKTGKMAEIRQSHAGSSVQARAIIDGLDADVVTLNQVTDMNALVDARRIAADWAAQFPSGASPYRSVTAFIVRPGNPKDLRDWQDLIRPGVQIVLANPKTSGNGRYAFLAAYGYALQRSGGDEKAAEEFMRQFLQHVPVLDAGGRGATNTFISHDIGDVLLNFESEADLIRSEFSGSRVDVVIPPLTMPVDFPVAMVEPVVREHRTRDLAQAYLGFLFSVEAQEIAGKFGYRVNDPTVERNYHDRHPATQLIDVDRAFGGWAAVQRKLFADDGLFDRLYRQ